MAAAIVVMAVAALVGGASPVGAVGDHELDQIIVNPGRDWTPIPSSAMRTAVAEQRTLLERFSSTPVPVAGRGWQRGTQRLFIFLLADAGREGDAEAHASARNLCPKYQTTNRSVAAYRRLPGAWRSTCSITQASAVYAITNVAWAKAHTLALVSANDVRPAELDAVIARQHDALERHDAHSSDGLLNVLAVLAGLIFLVAGVAAIWSRMAARRRERETATDTHEGAF